MSGDRAPVPANASIEVIAPNFKRRLSGVTATVERLVPLQSKSLGIVAFGAGLSHRVPRIGVARLFTLFQRPANRPARIWHARRNIEMLAGLVLRDVLRFPLKVVFTSASQRHHTRWSRFLIYRMDGVISTSGATATYLRRHSTVIRHGVDTGVFRPPEDREAAFRETGLPGRHAIGCFGRIRWQKGTDLFVDAMIRLLPAHPEFSAIVLGRATGPHIGYLRGMKEKVARAGLSGRILFPGEVPVHEVADWYRRLELFVAPQRWEGFGLTPIEAMACGVPVVAANVGAFRELIQEGKTGVLVAPGDVDALTAATGQLMEDAGRRAKMARAARRHVEQNFRLDNEVTALGAFYEKTWAAAEQAPTHARLSLTR